MLVLVQQERDLVPAAVGEERAALVQGVAAEHDKTMDALRAMVASGSGSAIEAAQDTAVEIVDRAIGGLRLIVGAGFGGLVIFGLVLVLMLRRVGCAARSSIARPDPCSGRRGGERAGGEPLSGPFGLEKMRIVPGACHPLDLRVGPAGDQRLDRHPTVLTAETVDGTVGRFE